MIDNECLKCKRLFSGSCHGTEDRGREEITVENSCSGFLLAETEDIIGEFYNIVTEFDARESGCNLIYERFVGKSWTELCEYAIKLLEQIK